MSAPILDLSLFKIRDFSVANIAQALYTLVFSGAILVLSLYLEIALGESALIAGLSILPLDIVYLLVGPLSGRLSDKHGTKFLCSGGLAIVSLSLFFLGSIATSSNSYDKFLIFLILFGLGSAMFASPNASAIMQAVPPQRRGVGSGFRATTFNAASTASFGVVVLVMTLAVPYNDFSVLMQDGTSRFHC